MLGQLPYLIKARKERLHASKKELKYWKAAGIKKGYQFYQRYIKAFGMRMEYFIDKKIGDFGCGPFGGVISVIDGYRSAYPIDILSEEYNMMGLSKERILKFDGKKTQLPAGFMDIIFCCNAMDHTRYPERIIKEINRLLRKGGEFFLSVHIREKSQTNITHPIAWNEKLLRRMFGKFHISWIRIDKNDVVNECDYKTLYAKLIK